MEVSPKTLREVEFREKMRGYHPEDVDHFLEQVAAGIEVLQDRLRQAVERAQRAEAEASDAGGADDTLRKTLVLAQRTADLAVQEAREQAARILASAEQQAQSILAGAEERARRTMEDSVADVRAELARLESSRSQAQQDVDTLQRWIEEHKAHLQASLSDALTAVEQAGVLWPAPVTRPVEGGRRTPAPPAVAPSPGPGEAAPGPQGGGTQGAHSAAGPGPVGEPAEAGPDVQPDSGAQTVMWTPSEDERAEISAPQAGAEVAGGGRGDYREEPTRADYGRPEGARNTGPDEQALDDFFDDNGDFDDDRRFGGRLRRRR